MSLSNPAVRQKGSVVNGASRLRRLATVTALLLALTVLAMAGGRMALNYAKAQLGPPPVDIAKDLSITVVDRKSQLLRAFTTTTGHWRLPVSNANVDQRYLRMLLTFEDKRFHQHGGVDVLSMMRAAAQFVTNGRIISGASTLTMQVARLIDRRHERSISGKFFQIVRALQLEENLSKDQILDLYLQLAPFGGNIEGVRAASLAYFGKEPNRLSLGQAALLVALPQSPESRRPDRHPGAARRSRDRVLDRVKKAGLVSAAESARAKLERVPTRRRSFPKFAPHLSERLVAKDQQEVAARARIHKLTIDRELQRSMERLARNHARSLGDKLSTAIIAVEHASGEIVAYVGSADYLDQSRLGAIDMGEAVRSPGSTLKPIVYGMGFELGKAHPEMLIEDRPARFGRYAPKNFDNDFNGTVTVREALARSLNIPAVKVLDAIGPERFAGRLDRAGISPVLPDATKPSLAMALGGVGLRLIDLTQAYASLANGGRYVKLHHRLGEGDQRTLRGDITDDAKRRLLSDVAAWYVTDILKDAPPPENGKSGRIAYKTGTSYGYRDALAVGYDGRHTIAVWVGRADGTSTPGLVGRVAAAPILFDAFSRIGERRAPLAQAPAGAIRTSGANLPPPLKRFRRPGQAVANIGGAFLEPPVVIAFPPDRAEIEMQDSDGPQPFLLKAEGGALPLTWLVNGAPIASSRHRRDVVWEPDGAGFADLSVVDAKGRVDRVSVRLK